jgi:uncharacterized protein
VPAGYPVAGLDRAVDCDLARSPVTNMMPVLRYRMHQNPRREEFVMAWVSMPDLEVRASHQVYEHLAVGRVRYEGRHRGFVGALSLDRDGLVLCYPGLAHLVTRD